MATVPKNGESFADVRGNVVYHEDLLTPTASEWEHGVMGDSAPAVKTKTYYWDFFGPRALGMAEHFARHTAEFLEKNGVAGCTIDTLSESDGHHAARCVAPESAWPVIEGSLRPKRSIE